MNLLLPGFGPAAPSRPRPKASPDGALTEGQGTRRFRRLAFTCTCSPRPLGVREGGVICRACGKAQVFEAVPARGTPTAHGTASRATASSPASAPAVERSGGARAAALGSENGVFSLLSEPVMARSTLSAAPPRLSSSSGPGAGSARPEAVREAPRTVAGAASAAAAAALTRREELVEEVRSFAAGALAPSTERAYTAAWNDWTAWCRAHGETMLPASPDAIAAYLTTRAKAGRKMATLERGLVAIAQSHKLRGLPAPTGDARVRKVFKGIRRALGVPQEGKAPVVTDVLRAMLAPLPTTLLGARDRALLLVGFAGAFRRSELVALDVRDLAFGRAGVVVTLRRSKTDQLGEGRKVGIPFGTAPELCPVRALRAWLSEAKLTEGAAFRSVSRHGRAGERLSGQSVALVVKRAAGAAGLDPALYAGHSLRAGLATSAAAAGASERTIMATTGHRSVTMVRRYIRDGEMFRENAAAFALR